MTDDRSYIPTMFDAVVVLFTDRRRPATRVQSDVCFKADRHELLRTTRSVQTGPSRFPLAPRLTGTLPSVYTLHVAPALHTP